MRQSCVFIKVDVCVRMVVWTRATSEYLFASIYFRCICEWTCVVCACEHAFVLVWRQQSYIIYFAVRCVRTVCVCVCVCVCVFINKLNKRTDYLLANIYFHRMCCCCGWTCVCRSLCEDCVCVCQQVEQVNRLFANERSIYFRRCARSCVCACVFLLLSWSIERSWIYLLEQRNAQKSEEVNDDCRHSTYDDRTVFYGWGLDTRKKTQVCLL